MEPRGSNRLADAKKRGVGVSGALFGGSDGGPQDIEMVFIAIGLSVREGQVGVDFLSFSFFINQVSIYGNIEKITIFESKV